MVEQTYGIPTTMIVRKEFGGLIANAFARMGFPAEAPMLTEFPHSVFYTGGDNTAITENIDKIVGGLTTWKPKITTTGAYHPGENLKLQGKDYAQALDNMNNTFLLNMWGDGLPMTPPTPEKVAWIMTGTDLAPEYIVPGCGVVHPRGGVADVKSLAICLAMAGGRPEYLPVLLAIAEAMTQTTDIPPQHVVVGYDANKGWNLAEMATTTRSTWPAFVVSGTISNQIRLPSGYGLLGPDPRHPANGSIGRAVRLMMQILGGAIPALGSGSNYGGMRFTNAVFAEDELGVPPSWPTLGEERGFARGENCVTGQPMGHFVSRNILSTSGENVAEGSLDGLLDSLEPSKRGIEREDLDRATGFIMFPDSFAKVLAEAGYTREGVKTYLFERLPTPPEGRSYANNPGQINIVVCGGSQAQHCYIMTASKQVSIRSAGIKLPKNWDDLLAQAEEDLGPNPGHEG